MNAEQYANISDQALLEKFYKDRDNEWLGLLLQRHTLMLFGVCLKYLKNEHDARDMVQHVQTKVLTDLPRYKVANFRPWLYIVAKTCCMMKFRNQPHPTVELTVDTVDDLSETFNKLEEEKKLALMHESLEELSEEQKQCVTLFYLEQKSYSQIAEQTGHPLSKVKSYLQNGKRNLKLFINKKLED